MLYSQSMRKRVSAWPGDWWRAELDRHGDEVQPEMESAIGRGQKVAANAEVGRVGGDVDAVILFDRRSLPVYGDRRRALLIHNVSPALGREHHAFRVKLIVQIDDPTGIAGIGGNSRKREVLTRVENVIHCVACAEVDHCRIAFEQQVQIHDHASDEALGIARQSR